MSLELNTAWFANSTESSSSILRVQLTTQCYYICKHLSLFWCCKALICHQHLYMWQLCFYLIDSIKSNACLSPSYMLLSGLCQYMHVNFSGIDYCFTNSFRSMQSLFVDASLTKYTRRFHPLDSR